MNYHQCEECGKKQKKCDVLVDNSTGLKYLFCGPCAHTIIMNEETFEYIETIQSLIPDEFRTSITINPPMTKHGGQVLVRREEPQETTEQREQKQQKILQEKIARAFQEMNDLVGMSHIKTELKQLLLQKEAKEYMRKHTNLNIEQPLMHTIIQGSSGTGKTELAKKLVSIFYQAGIIEEEKILFVKPEEIVGKYVGHTAPQTRSKIDAAQGGIFFLDEAYRLSEGSSKGEGADYGAEAIETIMSEMENGSNVVFVFAGYADKMQRFLEKNEGLSSRIPNRLTLHDYTQDELLTMALTRLKQRGYKTEKMEETLAHHIGENMTHGMLKGNGRTVGTYVDNIIGKHLERIIATPNKAVLDLEVILPEDVQASFEKTPTDKERLKASYHLAKEKINTMIGLSTVKAQLQEIGDYQYIQEKRKNVGLPTQKKSHHMFFLGEPGTGKTTMARLVGEMFRGSGVLSNGHFIEATKEKLTKGESIPSTVQRLITQAKGGVLFIDEAYALANDGKGKEALDSLIAHIENERDDLVVIMAGYKEDMQRLLALNEGLASRIPYHLEFAAYDAAELMEIAFDLFAHHQFHLTQEASDRLMTLVQEAKESDSVNGNARWVRNLFEQIQLIQSNRLVQKELAGESNTKEDYQTILEQDIAGAQEKIHIFSSQGQEKETEATKRTNFLQALEEHFEEMQKTKKVI